MDVQIGGGVRVGDAFQASVECYLIAIWGTWFCVEISQAGAFVSRSLRKEKYDEPPTGARKRSIVGGGYEWAEEAA